MRADLHVHTYYSDGELSPEEVAKRARAAGVSLLCMTDHDTLEGSEEKALAAKKYGISYVTGWEVSAYTPQSKVHVLGYGCRPTQAYLAFSEERKKEAIRRAEDIIKKLNAELNLSLTVSDAERFHTVEGTTLHTTHIVKAYAEAMHKSFVEVYSAHFVQGKSGYSLVGRPTPEEAVDVIHACGGLAVLAHPGQLTGEDGEKEALVRGLIRRGLDGIECYHSTHTALEAERYAAQAARGGLLITGGSDFHAIGRGREIGVPAFEPSKELLCALGLRA